MARSPNYPRLSLREAIGRIKEVYEEEHIHKVDREAVARDLGYKGESGASLGVISALRKYGLLQADGNKVRVSDDAVTIILRQKGDSERAQAIQRAALAPKLFAELYELYGNNLPSDAALRHDLIKKRFLQKAADEVIRIYRDNLEFVSEEAAEYTTADELAEEQSVEVEVRPQQSVDGPSASRVPDGKASVPASAEQSYLREFLHVFARGREVRLYIDEGAVTQETINRIIAHLNLVKEDLPLEGQPAVEQPAIEAPALEYAKTEQMQ